VTQRGTSKRTTAKHHQWQIPGFDQPFVQDPLSFFERNELFGVLAAALDRALGDGQDIASLISSLDIDEVTARRMLQGGVTRDVMATANLVTPLLGLVSSYPDLLQDIYLIALSVPKSQRELVREGLVQIDDETGFGIFDAFVDQNAEDLKRFALRWWESLSRAYQRIQGNDASPTPIS
jgi:hypothetical protein